MVQENGFSGTAQQVLDRYDDLDISSSSSEVNQTSRANKALLEAEAALKVAQDQELRRDAAQLWELMARAHLIKEDAASALEATEESIGISYGLQDSTLEASARLTASRARLLQGSADKALQAAEEVRSLGQQKGDTAVEVKALAWMAEIRLSTGSINEALDLCEEALSAAQFGADKDSEGNVYRILTQIHAETEDLDEALEAARKERLCRERAKNRRGAVQALHVISQLHLSRGETKASARAAEAACKICKQLKDPAEQVTSLSLAARAYLEQVKGISEDGELQGPIKEKRASEAGARAAAAADECMKAVQGVQNDPAQAAANMTNAEVMAAFGEWQKMLNSARAAVDALKRIGDEQSTAIALLRCAQGYQEMKTLGMMERAAEEALELFDKCNDSEGKAEAKKLLDSIGTTMGGGQINFDDQGGDGATAAIEGQSAAESGIVVPDIESVREIIRNQVEQTIGTSDDDIQNDTPLMDTGLDSLSSVQFRNDLSREFNVNLNASIMFDYPTISALSEKIVETIQDQAA
eukprot:TRINITY_DN2488_c2_g7_i1.p1 TRINITY_DN2488_c2_g7~~TRINITY_DN2488_c2_g7_i1.p1  ORF type:complete len:528 (+),score=144.02 TRINITY_DN2488_c2_g7_i1:83-1666(+)